MSYDLCSNIFFYAFSYLFQYTDAGLILKNVCVANNVNYH